MTPLDVPQAGPAGCPLQSTIPETTLQRDVWQKLSAWHPDDPASIDPFSRRLQRENGWTREHTSKAIDEYRRFLFLSQVAGHVVCPSEDVDQVWHQHLTCTRSYWEDLCGRILKRPLHHQPTTGGRTENERYAELYTRTLASYQEWFGCQPDPELWPCPAERFAAKDMQRVDRSKYLLIRRPSFRLPRLFAAIHSRLHEILWWPRIARAAGYGFAIVLLPAAIPLGPLDWTGGVFLKWYLTILVGGIIAAFLIRHILWPDDADVPENLRYYEVACLKGNWKLAVNSVLAKLLASKQVVAEVKAAKTQFLFVGSSVPDDGGFENAVANSLKRPTGLTMTDLHDELHGQGSELEESLRRKGLLTGNASYALAARVYSFLIMLAVALVGAAKVSVGYSRDKPVGFLISLLIIPAVLAIWCLIRTRQTGTVRRWLRQQQRERAGLKEEVGAAFRSPESVAIGTALFGAAALSGDQLLPLKTAWQANRTELGSSGCGTAGCGGSGCGGGCGGGGCGGCGGGGD